MRRPVLPSLALLAAAPLLMATDRCGVYIEMTENLQFLEPVERVVMDVHHGSLTGTAYARPSVYVKRHTSGFPRGVGEYDASVEGDALDLVGHCNLADECWYDHMLELPLGTGLDLTFLDGYIELSEIDAAIAASVGEGWFRGYRLAAPTLDLEFERGEVEVEYAVAPARVTIAVGEGTVALTLPAGSYACAFEPQAELAGITCDPAASASLAVTVKDGSIRVRGE